MSSAQSQRVLRAAYCEDYDEDEYPIPGSRRSAKVIAKRSKYYTKSSASEAGTVDSVYSNNTVGTSSISSYQTSRLSFGAGQDVGYLDITNSSKQRQGKVRAQSSKQLNGSVLRPPRKKFPEDPVSADKDVLPLKEAGMKGIPPNARWTKIDRKLVNPEALEMGNERFEERRDCIIVLRVLTKEEIERYAIKTQDIREMRSKTIEDKQEKFREEDKVEQMIGGKGWQARDKGYSNVVSSRKGHGGILKDTDYQDKPGEKSDISVASDSKSRSGTSKDLSNKEKQSIQPQEDLIVAALSEEEHPEIDKKIKEGEEEEKTNIKHFDDSRSRTDHRPISNADKANNPGKGKPAEIANPPKQPSAHAQLPHYQQNPRNPIASQSIPLQDLSRPPDSRNGDEEWRGIRRQVSGRARALLGNRRSFHRLSSLPSVDSAVIGSALPATSQEDPEDDASSVSSYRSSSVFSTNSAMSLLSQYSAQDLKTAIEELVVLLSNDERLKSLYLLAIDNERIGGDGLENKLRHLLRTFSYDLGNQAKDSLEKGAARLVWSRARYVANSIRRKFERSRFKDQAMHVLEDSDISSEEEIPSLKQVKLFMMTGDAVDNFRQNLWQFVRPEKARHSVQLPVQENKVVQLLSQGAPETVTSAILLSSSSTFSSGLDDMQVSINGKQPKKTANTTGPDSGLYSASALGFGGPSDWEHFGDYDAEVIDDTDLYITAKPKKEMPPLQKAIELSTYELKGQEDKTTPQVMSMSSDAAYSQRLYKEDPVRSSLDTSHTNPQTSQSSQANTESLDTTSQKQGKTGLGNVVGSMRERLSLPATKSCIGPGSSKTPYLYDQGRTLYFTPGSSVPDPGFVNGVKQFIELSILGRHVNWWPLQPNITCCPRDHTRVSWYCNCGTELFIDVTAMEAEEYARQCSPIIFAPDNSTVLPMYNDISTTTSNQSSNGQNNSTTSSILTQRTSSQQPPTLNDPMAKDTHQHKIIHEKLRDRYVHWCVNANSFETRLNHIPIFSMKDVKFIHDLKAAYNSVIGVRRYFSLTSCYGVKFIIFERIHRTKELVACGPEDLPCPTTNKDYAYQYLDPRALFTKTLEKSLMHHFHNPRGCGAEDIEDVLSRIPKKITGKLVNKYGIQGYGIQAVSGWALWKFLFALLISQIGPMVFAAKWLLGGHPGDLQNAFMVSMWVFAAVGSVVVVPDVWQLRD